MKNFLKTLFITTSIFALSSTLNADLVWNKERGWQVQGGVLTSIMGSGVNIENALDGMNLAQKEFDEENWGTSISIYQQIVGEYPDSIFAPEAYYQMGLAYTNRHQWDSANYSLEQIIKSYPDYPKYNQIIGAQFNIAYLIQAGEIQYLWGWMPWFSDYNEAIEIYENVVKNSPYSEYAQMALINIAICAEKNDKSELAIDALDRLINTYPQSIFVSDAYLQLAKTYRNMVEGPAYDQKSTKEAIAFYGDYLVLFPNEKEVAHVERGLEVMKDTLARSRLVMGDFYYYYRNDAKAASIFYNETITSDPKSLAAEQAREQLQLIAEGVDAPMTPVDWFFGRYEKPTIEEFEEDEKVEEMHSEVFQAIQARQYILEDAFINDLAGERIIPANDPLHFIPILPNLNEEGFVEETE